jgi:hypothetical protein
MATKGSISQEEAGLLIDKLMRESIPVVAFFVSKENVQVKFRGFVDSVTSAVGLVLCTVQGAPAGSANSYLAIPMGDPVGTGCKFVYGDKRELPEEKREEWAGRLGEAALSITVPYGARLNLFFTL